MRRILFLLVLAACSRSPSEPSAPADTPPATPVASGSNAPAVAPHAMQHPATAPSGRPATLALHWDDPPRWQKRVPSSPMRAMEYRVPRTGADAEDAECSVITFGPGQGGNVDENIERWVKQLQPASTAVERTKRTVNGMTVTRVELGGTYTPMAMPSMPGTGPHPNSRLVGDIVEAPSGLWFFKLTGPDATVKAAGKELDKLVDSIGPS